MKIVKYGILSTASIVPRFVNAVRETAEGEVVAIASRGLERAQAKADELHIPKAYASYKELVEDSDVDVVYIASINSEHYSNCLLALNAGKHVVCEKPLTLTSAQTKHLFTLAKEKNCFMFEAQKVVFLPTINQIKQRLNQGDLGRVHMLDLTSSCAATYNNWLGSLEAGGGCLYGNASYSLHLIQHLFDCKIEDYSGLSVLGEQGADVQTVINLKLPNDILVVSKISTRVNAINKAFIYAERGYIEIPDYWKARKATIHFHTGKVEEIEFPCQHELVYEVQHVHECLAKGLLESPVMNQEMSVATLDLMENIQNTVVLKK
ncbi:Gfo/Idh/MocA family protein [Photobacterium satsumensis]|uniref:Gfo/Idh/MocA family protein n=1 Tax=Photobacterium satsumensis TaxID=2910239 RepID=UPI003D099FB4